MKIKRPDWHCENCIWMLKDNVCPFVRCVWWDGFKTDEKKVSE